MKEKIIKEIKRRIEDEKKHMEFNLFQMDICPEYKEYHHREYLISYYKIQELSDLLQYIESEVN